MNHTEHSNSPLWDKKIITIYYMTDDGVVARQESVVVSTLNCLIDDYDMDIITGFWFAMNSKDNETSFTYRVSDWYDTTVS